MIPSARLDALCIQAHPSRQHRREELSIGRRGLLWRGDWWKDVARGTAGWWFRPLLKYPSHKLTAAKAPAVIC
jgi:hypothetical protein